MPDKSANRATGTPSGVGVAVTSVVSGSLAIVSRREKLRKGPDVHGSVRVCRRLFLFVLRVLLFVVDLILDCLVRSLCLEISRLVIFRLFMRRRHLKVGLVIRLVLVRLNGLLISMVICLFTLVRLWLVLRRW